VSRGKYGREGEVFRTESGVDSYLCCTVVQLSPHCRYAVVTPLSHSRYSVVTDLHWCPLGWCATKGILHVLEIRFRLKNDEQGEVKIRW
jgi:hypothetical protein